MLISSCCFRRWLRYYKKRTEKEIDEIRRRERKKERRKREEEEKRRKKEDEMKRLVINPIFMRTFMSESRTLKISLLLKIWRLKFHSFFATFCFMKFYTSTESLIWNFKKLVQHSDHNLLKLGNCLLSMKNLGFFLIRVFIRT